MTKSKAKLVPMLCIILSVIFLSGLTVGCTYPINDYNYNTDFLGNLAKQETVPDNYTGIYSLEDLLATENAPADTNFILMNNIDIPDSAYDKGGILEGGFTPLTCNEGVEHYKQDPYGIFDGNGYVIRNLKIYADLSDASDSVRFNEYYIGLFAKHDASIRNLGIENCEIVIDAPGPAISVGAFCGRAQSITGCYATDVSIKVTQSNSLNKEELLATTNIGGIAGCAQYIDCCYTDAEITVTGNKPSDENNGPATNVAGVAGKVFATVTSYSTGSVTTDGYFSSLSKDDCVISDMNISLPVLIPDYAMEKIIAKFDEKDSSTDNKYDKHSFECKRFMSYYTLREKNTEINTGDEVTGNQKDELGALIKAIISSANLFIGDITEVDGWALCDPNRSIAEDDAIAKILTDLFGDYQAFMSFCMENNIKCGNLYSRALDADKTYTEEDLPEFDFERIWEIKDGKPVLKIFG